LERSSSQIDQQGQEEAPWNAGVPEFTTTEWDDAVDPWAATEQTAGVKSTDAAELASLIGKVSLPEEDPHTDSPSTTDEEADSSGFPQSPTFDAEAEQFFGVNSSGEDWAEFGSSDTQFSSTHSDAGNPFASHGEQQDELTDGSFNGSFDPHFVDQLPPAENVDAPTAPPPAATGYSDPVPFEQLEPDW
jgi:hypothetical protein